MFQLLRHHQNWHFQPNNDLVKTDDVIIFCKFEFQNVLSLLKLSSCEKINSLSFTYTKFSKFKFKPFYEEQTMMLEMMK